MVLALFGELCFKQREAGVTFFAVQVQSLGLHLAKGQPTRVSSKKNVDTTTGHVGRYGHGPWSPCLRDDFGFSEMLLRVQDFVVNPSLAHQAREFF